MRGTLMIRGLWVKEWAPTAWTDGLYGRSCRSPCQEQGYHFDLIYWSYCRWWGLFGVRISCVFCGKYSLLIWCVSWGFWFGSRCCLKHVELWSLEHVEFSLISMLELISLTSWKMKNRFWVKIVKCFWYLIFFFWMLTAFTVSVALTSCRCHSLSLMGIGITCR